MNARFRWLALAATLLGITVVCANAPTRQAGQLPEPAWQQLPSRFARSAVFVRVTVNGGEAIWAILDTGSAVTALDIGLAKRRGLQEEARPDVANGQGQDNQPLSVADVNLGVGGISHSVKRAFLLPLDSLFSQICGLRVEGILGSDFFRDRVVRIDYDHQRVDVCGATPLADYGQGDVVPLIVGRFATMTATVIPTLEMPVGAALLVDTGSLSELCLSPRFADRFGLLREAPAGAPAETQVITGRMAVRPAAIAEIRFGPCGFRGVLALVGDYPVFRGSLADGSIGAGLLREFTVVFDYSRSRMMLTKGATTYRHGKFGIAIMAEGEELESIRVAVVAPGSQAAEAGFEKGDLVLSFDNKPAGELGIGGIGDLLDRPQDRHCPVRIQRGDLVKELSLDLRQR
jgi:hypothetical protein